MHSNVYSSTVYNNQDKEAPKCPLTNECIKEVQYIYIIEYNSAIKKNEIMSFAATWMDLESVILSDISQGRRNIAWHPLYEESTKKQYKNGLIYKIQRDSQAYKMNLWLPGGRGS